MNAAQVLVVFYSRHGATAELARQVCRGIDSVAGAASVLRSVPAVSADSERAPRPVPDSGAPYATHDDLRRCDALLIGSPTRFGNMAAPLKYFLDSTSAIWADGGLAGKPAAVFSGSSSLHGGQESTLLSMMLPLLHHGMYLVGVPYAEPALTTTRGGGSPYGATHFTPQGGPPGLSEDERAVARSLGARVAALAVRLRAADCAARPAPRG